MFTLTDEWKGRLKFIGSVIATALVLVFLWEWIPDQLYLHRARINDEAVEQVRERQRKQAPLPALPVPPQTQ